MYYLHTITNDAIPKRLHGAEAGYSLRPLSTEEVLSIEDRLFAQGRGRRLFKLANTIILPDATRDPTEFEEFACMTEFAMALLTAQGHPSFSIVALFSSGRCVAAKYFSRGLNMRPRYKSSVTSKVACEWLRRCVQAKRNQKDRLYITTQRYIRHARTRHAADALLDLSISLESLLDAQTEISFRFATCLAKITGARGTAANEMATLLSELYDVRSKIAHGDPKAIKLVQAMELKLPALRRLAQKILVNYILFMSEHTRKEWSEHVRMSLFA